jgi:hypothetical protein
VPQKGRLTKERERAEKLYYRWEFIRRNEAYKSDQAKFVFYFSRWFKRRGLLLQDITGHNQDLFEKHGIYRKRISDYFMRNIAPIVEAFSRKWGVRWPCPPTYTFNPDDLNYFSDNGTDITQNYWNSPISSLRCDLRLDANIGKLAEELYDFVNPTLGSYRKRFGGTAVEEPISREKEQSLLVFRVRPGLGKERNYELFHQFMRKIEWPNRNDLKERSTKRFHLKKYSSYLQVWDLKHSDPSLTWTEIAKRLYPKKFNQYSSGSLIGEKNSATQQVIDQYKSAQRLIAGGFQEIR